MNPSTRAGGGHECGRGRDTTPTPHLCAQVALDVIEELCCEMGLQRREALDEYILFVVTNRGEGPIGSVNATRRAPSGDPHCAEAAGAAQGRACDL